MPSSHHPIACQSAVHTAGRPRSRILPRTPSIPRNIASRHLDSYRVNLNDNIVMLWTLRLRVEDGVLAGRSRRSALRLG